MKTIKIKNSRNQNLVADFYNTDSENLIIMAHGFTGDRHEWGKFDQIAESFNNANYNVLNFDFSGSGESDDDSLTVAKEVDDLKSVIRYARDNNYKDIILFGLSLGGLISFSSYDGDIKAIVAMAPVTDKVQPGYVNRKYTEEQLEELKETGKITYTRDKGFRKTIIIDGQMFEDRENLNQKELLKNINCPVLILHGDEDDRVPIEDSQRAVEILGSEAKLYTIKGEGHGFLDNIDTVINKTLDWLKDKI